jgi:uncharacterized protein
LQTAKSLRILRGVVTPMSDGIDLVADVWLPDGEGPWPTLLQRLPYDRSSSFMTQHIVGLETLRALDAGFALVVQDTRGRYDSAGRFEPFVNEAADGRDTIAWAAEQPWCDGRVAMFGASYNGATQMLAASQSPPSLVAIAPQLTASEYYDGWTYKGGALQLAFVLLWLIDSLVEPDIARRLEGRDAATAVSALKSLRTDPNAVFAHLPVDRDELSVLAPYFREWMRYPAPDEYWNRINPSRRYSTMNLAGLHIAGWNDLFLEGSLRNYIGMRTGSATQDSRNNQFLLIGPWSHGNLGDWQGDEWLGPEAAAGAIDLTSVHLDFFAAILEGRRPDMPRVRYFTSGIDRWQSADDWPVASRELPLYLTSSGNAAKDSADGALTPKRPEHAGTDTWRSDPFEPVPTVGGATFLPGMLYGRNSGPMDQSTVESRDDVVTYTTESLAANLEVTGSVRLIIHATSDATDCDWTARLVDVGADGTTRSVVDGILRARYRNGLTSPLPLTPGAIESYEIDLGNISHVFLSGHRVRLQVASSNFPRFDRNPQQYIPIAQAAAKDFRMATQTVWHGSNSPSRLLLPVIDDRPPEDPDRPGDTA